MLRIAAVILFALLSSPSWAADEQVVFSQSANGIRNSRPFGVKSNWEIRWQSNEALAITAFRADTKDDDPLGKMPISTASQTKGGRGSTYIRDGGSFYLQITAMGDWTITVVQLP